MSGSRYSSTKSAIGFNPAGSRVIGIVMAWILILAIVLLVAATDDE